MDLSVYENSRDMVPYELIRFVGRVKGGGAYANVRSAEYRGRAIAVKTYKMFDGVLENFDREVRFMKMLGSSYHIASFIGTSIDKSRNLCMLMDVAFNLSLKSFLDAIQTEIGGEVRLMIARDLCRGLGYMHKRKVAHGDIKTQNILLDFGNRAKLCDFGSTVREEDQYLGVTGTKDYWPPEVREWKEDESKKYDRKKADVHCLGQVFEVLLPPAYASVAEKCMDPDPQKRPACETLLKWLARDASVFPNFQSFVYPSRIPSLSDIEKMNICYYWTDIEGNCEHYDQGRSMLLQGAYKPAFLEFKKCDCTGTSSGLLKAIMMFHGCGCDKDVKQCLEVLTTEMEDFEDDHVVYSLARYYQALSLYTENKSKGNEVLMSLCWEGNSLAQAYVAYMYGLIEKWELPGTPDNPVALSASGHSSSYHREKSRFVARGQTRFLFAAAASGHAQSQALLALSIMRKERSTRISGKCKYFLKRGDEGGCLLARILMEITEETIEDNVQIRDSNNAALFRFVGEVYNAVGEILKSLRWHSLAATKGEEESARFIGNWGTNSTILLQSSERGHRMSSYDLALQYLRDGVVDLALEYFGSDEPKVTDAYSQEGTEQLAMISCLFTIENDQRVREIERKKERKRKRESEDSWASLLRSKMQSLHTDFVLETAYMFLDAKRYAEAEVWIGEALEREHPDAQEAMGARYVYEGLDDKVCEWYERAFTKTQSASSAYFLANCTSLEYGKRRMYMESAAKAGEVWAMTWLARALLYEGDLSRAKSHLTQAVKYGNEDCSVYLALLCKELGQQQESAYWMGRARVAFASSPDSWMALEHRRPTVASATGYINNKLPAAGDLEREKANYYRLRHDYRRCLDHHFRAAQRHGLGDSAVLVGELLEATGCGARRARKLYFESCKREGNADCIEALRRLFAQAGNMAAAKVVSLLLKLVREGSRPATELQLADRMALAAGKWIRRLELQRRARLQSRALHWRARGRIARSALALTVLRREKASYYKHYVVGRALERRHFLSQAESYYQEGIRAGNFACTLALGIALAAREEFELSCHLIFYALEHHGNVIRGPLRSKVLTFGCTRFKHFK